jgi:hypothetical protein
MNNHYAECSDDLGHFSPESVPNNPVGRDGFRSRTPIG